MVRTNRYVPVSLSSFPLFIVLGTAHPHLYLCRDPFFFGVIRTYRCKLNPSDIHAAFDTALNECHQHKPGPNFLRNHLETQHASTVTVSHNVDLPPRQITQTLLSSPSHTHHQAVKLRTRKYHHLRRSRSKPARASRPRRIMPTAIQSLSIVIWPFSAFRWYSILWQSPWEILRAQCDRSPTALFFFR